LPFTQRTKLLTVFVLKTRSPVGSYLQIKTTAVPLTSEKKTLACIQIHLAAAGTTQVSGRETKQNMSCPQNCIHQHISKAICTALFTAEEN